ncbi:hypothetical protein NLJ89_g7924 [Agrocybe chaxingu]|uniref:Uncharacterized protein n=1 Tax=Agrocybe chaxingu TaxID=84603 RepID=A0A9W8MUK9_9AGAR|nr:hypothetical protein NLJ89_g7924 [Agrocybe chaxingu]
MTRDPSSRYWSPTHADWILYSLRSLSIPWSPPLFFCPTAASVFSSRSKHIVFAAHHGLCFIEDGNDFSRDLTCASVGLLCKTMKPIEQVIKDESIKKEDVDVAGQAETDIIEQRLIMHSRG